MSGDNVDEYAKRVVSRETYSSAVAESADYTNWLLSLFPEGLRDSILEVGLGHGSYTERLSVRPGYCGVDIDADAVRAAASRFPAGRFSAVDISDSSAMSELGTGFGSIVCLNVLEHVPDHRQALINMLNCLVPGGRLLLFVPAHPVLFNDMDRLAGHERRYTQVALRDLLKGLPADLVRAEYVNPIGGLGWFLNRGVRHRSLNGGAADKQIRLFMKFLFPLSVRMSRLTRNLFGQSLVAEVVRR